VFISITVNMLNSSCICFIALSFIVMLILHPRLDSATSALQFVWLVAVSR